MDVESGFPCLKCGAPEVHVFYFKTGERAGWSCSVCKRRGYFKDNKAILSEA